MVSPIYFKTSMSLYNFLLPFIQCNAEDKWYLIFITRGFWNKHKDVRLELYRTLVRLHLEYWVHVWLHNLKEGYSRDRWSVVMVHRKLGKQILPGKIDSPYEERLSRLGLYSHEFRRMTDDLIEVYSILTGFGRVNERIIFPLLVVYETGMK